MNSSKYWSLPNPPDYTWLHLNLLGQPVWHTTLVPHLLLEILSHYTPHTFAEINGILPVDMRLLIHRLAKIQPVSQLLPRGHIVILGRNLRLGGLHRRIVGGLDHHLNWGHPGTGVIHFQLLPVGIGHFS